jgi:hypothetical protein
MPPSWQTPIRLRVILRSFQTRCRARRWIIQDADMLLGTAQRALLKAAATLFCCHGRTRIEGAEWLGCGQTREYHPAACGGVTMAGKGQPRFPSPAALPTSFNHCAEQADLLKITYTFRSSDHLVDVPRTQPVDWSLVIGVSAGRDEPPPRLVR